MRSCCDFILRNVPPEDPRLDPKYASLSFNFEACPYYELIKKCAQLAEPDSSLISNVDRYCGHLIKKVDDMGHLCGRRGEDYIPDMACKRVFLELERQLMQIDPDLKIFDKSNFLKAFVLEEDVDKIDNLLTTAHKEIENEKISHKLYEYYRSVLGIARGNPAFPLALSRMMTQLKEIFEKNQCPLIPKEYFEGEVS